MIYSDYPKHIGDGIVIIRGVIYIDGIEAKVVASWMRPGHGLLPNKEEQKPAQNEPPCQVVLQSDATDSTDVGTPPVWVDTPINVSALP